MLNLATGFLHDSESAEDVVQESLLRLWLLRERIDSQSDFAALSVRIAKNVCISLWRQRQKGRVVPLEAISEIEGSPTASDIENDEKRKLLAKALEGLSPTERRIFTLWQQDLSIQQIATITGTKSRTSVSPPSAVS